MNAYTGTQESVNTFFAKLELQTGLCEPYHLAKKMGIALNDPATEMVPSFTLGVASVSPLELADAYATFAARGLHCDPRPVVSIDDSNGNQLKTYPQQCQQVIAAPVADAVNDVLRGVHVADRASAPACCSTRSRPARPAPTTTTCRCGSWATPPTSPPPRWWPAPTSLGPLDHPERPDHRRRLHRRRARLHHRRPDVVRRDEVDPELAARRDVHPAQRRRTSTACSPRCPTWPGCPSTRPRSSSSRPASRSPTAATATPATAPTRPPGRGHNPHQLSDALSDRVAAELLADIIAVASEL